MIFLTDITPDLSSNDDIIEISKLGLDQSLLNNLISQYNITEFNTTMKPFVFIHLMEKYQAKEIVYFDPDILIFSSVEEIWENLKTQNFIVTPHLLTNNAPGNKYKMILASINTGVFNLGFFALRVNHETRKFLFWWRSHLIKYGRNKLWEGQFYDQKVLNLLPVFYDGVMIMKHPGMNVAPWNFHERFLSKRDVGYASNGRSLIFFHFSGIKINSKYYGENIELIKDGKLNNVYSEIVSLYIKLNLQNGYNRLSKIKCKYKFHPDIHKSSKLTVYTYKAKRWFLDNFRRAIRTV